jgi:RNAse (barnase) inhibitor barstar
MDPQELPHYKVFINACLAVLIILILGEFIYPDYIHHEVGEENLEIIELVLSLILLTDIAISFVKAADKKTFLKKNMLRIIAVFPWGFVFRGLALLRIEAELPMLTEFLAAETEAAAAGRFAGRGFRLTAKAKELFEEVRLLRFFR